MKTITICVEFREWGRAFINIIETEDPQWEPEESSCRDYQLSPGTYTVTFNGQTGDGFKITAKDSDGNQLGFDSYEGGEFAGSIFINVD
jgi:hypothetical protein